MQPISMKSPLMADPLAQSVEHNTFNVGVLGSSPKRITQENGKPLIFSGFKSKYKMMTANEIRDSFKKFFES